MNKNSTEDINYKTDLKEFPDDHQKLFELLASESEDLDLVEQQIYQNKFYQWLNQSGTDFSKAKDRLIKKQLLLAKDWSLQASSQIEHKYTLEYICCWLVRSYLKNDIMLDAVLAHKSSFNKILNAIQIIQNELKVHPNMALGNSVIQQVFKATLHELSTSNTRNIYTLGKSHPFIARDIITKRAIGMLYPYYSRYNDVSNNFITDIAINITEQFFNTKTENNPDKLAKKIKADLEENSLLMNMTIENYLIHLNSKKI